MGALLPYIERTYNINYTQVSVLFVCTFLGYAVAAVTAGTLARKAGFGRALFISTLVEMVGVCHPYRHSPSLADAEHSGPHRT